MIGAQRNENIIDINMVTVTKTLNWSWGFIFLKQKFIKNIQSYIPISERVVIQRAMLRIQGYYYLTKTKTIENRDLIN